MSGCLYTSWRRSAQITASSLQIRMAASRSSRFSGFSASARHSHDGSGRNPIRPFGGNQHASPEETMEDVVRRSQPVSWRALLMFILAALLLFVLAMTSTSHGGPIDPCWQALEEIPAQFKKLSPQTGQPWVVSISKSHPLYHKTESWLEVLKSPTCRNKGFKVLADNDSEVILSYEP